MGIPADGGNGHRRRKLRTRVRAEGRPCALCGQPIDYSLDSSDPMAFVLDERLPRKWGGDPLSMDNVQPAHRCCNSRKGALINPVFAAPGILLEDLSAKKAPKSSISSEPVRASTDWSS